MQQRFRLLCNLFVVLLHALLVFAANNTTVKIGVILSESGELSFIGKPSKNVTQLWVNHVRNGIPGTDIKIEVIYANTNSSASITTNVTKALIDQGVQILTVPELSLAMVAGIVAEANKIPFVVGMSAITDVFVCSKELPPPCTLEGERRFEYATGVMAPSVRYFQNFFAPLKVKKASTTAIVFHDDNLSRDICMGGYEQSYDYGFEVVLFKVIPNLGPDTDGVKREDDAMLTIIYELKEKKPDTIVWCHYLACQRTVRLFRRANYLPKAMGIYLCMDYMNQFPNDIRNDMNYFFSPTQWDYRTRGRHYSDLTDYMFPFKHGIPHSDKNSTTSSVISMSINKTTTLKPSSQQFDDMYQNFTKSVQHPNYLSASHLAGLYAIQYAIQRCNCVDSETIQQTLRQIYLPCFFGLLSVDNNGQNAAKEMLMYQVQNGALEVISPIMVATADIVYPMPTFDERVYIHRMYSRTSEYIVLGLVSVFMVITMTTAIFIVLYRSEQSVRAGGWLFLLLSLVGGMIACLALLTWPLEDNNITCSLRLPSIILGFGLNQTPLIAKTYRIYRIFSTKITKKVNIHDQKLLLITLGLMLPLLMIMIVWIAVAPLQPIIVQVDVLRPIYNYTECKTEEEEFIYVLCALMVVYLLVSCYYVYVSRGVYYLFDDAKPLAMSVYCLAFTLIVVFTMHFAITTENREIVYVLRSVGTIVAYSTSLFLLCLPRLLVMYEKKDEKNDEKYKPKPLMLNETTNVSSSASPPDSTLSQPLLSKD